ncbi:MAG: hypothetical protein ABSB76_27955 [Streptosporangiaceae bacterium]
MSFAWAPDTSSSTPASVGLTRTGYEADEFAADNLALGYGPGPDGWTGLGWAGLGRAADGAARRVRADGRGVH